MKIIWFREFKEGGHLAHAFNSGDASLCGKAYRHMGKSIACDDRFPWEKKCPKCRTISGEKKKKPVEEECKVDMVDRLFGEMKVWE